MGGVGLLLAGIEGVLVMVLLDMGLGLLLLLLLRGFSVLVAGFGGGFFLHAAALVLLAPCGLLLLCALGALLFCEV